MIELGGREFPVPPLTLGRFQRLLELDTRAIVERLLAEQAVAGGVIVRAFNRVLRWSILHAPRMKRPLWWLVRVFGIGRGMRRASGAAPLVATVIPGITVATWREHGSLAELMRLFTLYVEAHDWTFISESIRFGEPLAPGEIIPTPTDVTAGLIAVSREAGYTIEGLTSMRVEGFYRLVDGLRSRVAAPEPGNVTEPFGASGLPEGMVREHEVPAGLKDLLDRATGETRGE